MKLDPILRAFSKTCVQDQLRSLPPAVAKNGWPLTTALPQSHFAELLTPCNRRKRSYGLAQLLLIDHRLPADCRPSSASTSKRPSNGCANPYAMFFSHRIGIVKLLPLNDQVIAVVAPHTTQIFQLVIPALCRRPLNNRPSRAL